MGEKIGDKRLQNIETLSITQPNLVASAAVRSKEVVVFLLLFLYLLLLPVCVLCACLVLRCGSQCPF